jgi:c-di-GMP-binding flagellar brake protein YcgR
VILFLLQNQASYFKEDDPMAGYFILGLIGVIVIISLIKKLLGKNQVMTKGQSKSSSVTYTRKFSIFSMMKIRNIYGLTSEQGKVLDFVFKSNGVTDPERTVANPSVLDKCFKQTYRYLEKISGSDESGNEKIAMLFSTRNAIDVFHNTSPASASAQTLSSGMEVVLTADQASYQVKVISTPQNSVLVEIPSTSIGSPVRFPKGTRAKLAFVTKTNKSFSLNCQIIDTENTSFGPALVLSRSHEVRAMTQRRFRRKQVVLDCGFFMVNVEETKRNKPPKLTVDRRRMSGTITDISIGGCGIKTQIPAAAGSRLKIEFDAHRTAAAVLGQVLRVNRIGMSYSIMHIRFLKVPRKAINSINAVVFDYV